MTFFANSDPEAERRFKEHFNVDPFPDIPSALLNSADIRSYIGATGLVYPFANDDSKFKTASYEIDLLGKCVYWDEHGQKIVKEISVGEEFTLHPNSIAFVTLEPTFRLPQYIAIRFNLKITHVYRGILLGTGPLVDPGYRNKLSIPLHNLTTNPYVFKGGEGLIWMEFTKLSHPSSKFSPLSSAPSKWEGPLADFPREKNKLSDVEDYIRKGEPHRSVRSSIPQVFQEAQKAVQEGRNALTEFRKEFSESKKQFALGGLVALVFSLGLGVYPIVSLVHDVTTTLDNARSLLASTEQKILDQSKEIRELREEIKKKRDRKEPSHDR
jgi:deoxycytidine triphosphate deaminase